jgi:sulfatase maturation enzyme AslB (radical SAM superfamily)
MRNITEARIEVSTICNYHCYFCPHGSAFTREKTIMSSETFRKVVDRLGECDGLENVTISGMGEPFMDGFIANKIKLLCDRGYRVHILTNGAVFFPHIVRELFDIGVASIRISLQGITHETMYAISGASLMNYYRTMQAINTILVNNANRPPDEKIRFGLTTTSCSRNKAEQQIMVNMFSRVVDVMEIWRPHNWVDFGGYRQVEPAAHCKRPFSGPLQIQVDGTVNACCFDYNGQLEYGSLLTHSIEDVLSSAAATRLKRLHTEGNLSGILCGQCDQMNSKTDVLLYSSRPMADRTDRLSSTFKPIWQAR